MEIGNIKNVNDLIGSSLLNSYDTFPTNCGIQSVLRHSFSKQLCVKSLIFDWFRSNDNSRKGLSKNLFFASSERLWAWFILWHGCLHAGQTWGLTNLDMLKWKNKTKGLFLPPLFSVILSNMKWISCVILF